MWLLFRSRFQKKGSIRLQTDWISLHTLHIRRNQPYKPEITSSDYEQKRETNDEPWKTYTPVNPIILPPIFLTI